MAKQTGLIKLKGTVGGVTFYKTKDGHLAKEKTSLDGARIQNDPSFARTRENGQEFGEAAKDGKLIRDALRTFINTAHDKRVTSRLTQTMIKVLKHDNTSLRGARTVAVAINQAPAMSLLKGFNFNKNSILGTLLVKPYTLNTATGVITINDLVPVNDIVFPASATHVTIKGAWARTNFGAKTFQVEPTNVVNLPIDGTSSNVVLTPAAVPNGAGTNLFILQLEFFQEVNGVQYSLKNGAYNALSILEVQ